MKKILQSEKLFMRFIFITILFVSFVAPQYFAQTLVGWWKMDEGSGTTLVDASSEGNNGTIVGGPTWSSGVDGLAINLNGTTRYATVPDDASLDITSAITLSAWIKPNVTKTQYIIKKAIQASINGYELSLSSGQKVFVRFNQLTSGDTYRINSSTSYPIDGNTWMHIAATYDGANIKLFINGIQEGGNLAAAISIAANNEVLGIGVQSNLVSASVFSGALDDARIYNGALSAAEILALATVPPKLISPLDGAAGIIIPPTLSWTLFGTPDSYRVQVSTVSDFSTTVFDQSGITTTSTSVTGLSTSTLYYWRVNATKSGLTSSWSSTQSFTTITPLFNGGAGYALDLDGTDDYVTVADNNSLDLTTGATLEAWIRPDIAATQRIIHKLSGVSGYELFLSSAGAGQLISFRINGTGVVSKRVNSNISYPTDGTWLHIAAVHDGTNIKLYVNGIQASPDSAAPSIAVNTTGLTIGADAGGAGDLNAGIDEVRIWNVGRSETQIRDNMCKKLAGNESGLVAYWRFNEVSGSTVIDEKGINNGSLIGDGGERTWSGAALGDASEYDYTGPDSTDFTASVSFGTESITATGSSGTITGLQVFRADDNSFRTGSTVDSSSWTLDPFRFWGVKVFGTGAEYNLVYNYTNHPGIITGANLRVVKRNNLSDASWEKVIITSIDTIAKTITINDQSGTEYALASTSDPLPVELNAFSAAVIKGGIKLKWQTQTEVSNYGFEILRSTQDEDWNVIGFVEGNGNSNSPKNYSFIDEKVNAGKYSYRLKQIDTDGSYEYSKVIEINFGSEAKFELGQNYPNPFNPVTTISYSVPEAGEVRLTIYNILGEEVAALVKGFKDAGVHTVDFNASQFNSGFYIYRLEAGKFVQVRKMMLVK